MSIPSHMTLTGKNQGAITGDCTMADREETILVYGLEHEIKMPTHKLDGLPTGKRVHEALKVIVERGQHSPCINQALCTGERFDDVTIKQYRIDDTGYEQHYYTVVLENAIVCGVKYTDAMADSADEQQNVRHLEHISFSYEKITWTHETASKAAQDSWKAPVA